MTYKRKRPVPAKRRALQSKICKRHKPWQRTTGPKTEAGKAASAANSLKHGNYNAQMQAIRKWLAYQRKYLQNCKKRIIPILDSLD